MNHMVNFKKWFEGEIINEESRNELLAIQNDNTEIKERFYKNLEFGTGGLRGLIGVGKNRMNIYTVRKVTQGLGNFIKLSYYYNSSNSEVIDFHKFIFISHLK